MGNPIIKTSLIDKVSVIASNKTWIEGGAIQQLHKTAELPGMLRAVGLPDLHPGRGYPIGAAFLTQGRFYPALIGGDIGCGMRLCMTNIDRRQFSLDKLAKRIGNIDGPLIDESAAWRERVQACGLEVTGHQTSLGSIGGGNHFAEVQELDTIDDPVRAQELGLDAKRLLILVHSGSRGFGGEVLRSHIDQYQHHGLEANSIEETAYFEQHDLALCFALHNRALIEQRLLERLNASARLVLDVHHNFLERVERPEGILYLHRKGAAPADRGPVVIPGSRGDYSYLVEAKAPIGDSAVHVSLASLAHGAGRKWQRSECYDRLSPRYTQEQLQRTKLGSRVICADKHLLFEEAPEAYKSIASVIAALQDAGLIRVIARLKPVLSYKTAGACCV
ncbi:RNA ligase RtcB family protein [Undibacterium cyanobacteriorum]|uniref:3'-phosphate/5'-hydroxy nucleic acid ligase n=1 Tax=Undibacterium cyanobacteriorum TaxID=3073561 RepID=A0ABY9RJX8_9BURK|nr:RNA ligase RtcB family protein [Undibacterium sp. 20NA77.5]WMW81530.1 RNA ligase RtcB family protein [Undibacterium sp. 20NA77.5]